jgi:hypothetical protein
LGSSWCFFLSSITGWRTVSIPGRVRISLSNSAAQQTQIKCITKGANNGLFLCKVPIGSHSK